MNNIKVICDNLADIPKGLVNKYDIGISIGSHAGPGIIGVCISDK